MRINMTWTLGGFMGRVILIGGVLWVEYYGFSVIVLWLIIFWILCFMDTVLWYAFANYKNVVMSKTRQQWLTIKSVQFLILGGFTLLLGHGAYSTDNAWIDAGTSIMTALAITGFCWGQLLSILENLAMMTHGSEQRVITVLIKFLTKVFGIGEKVIEDKLDRYTK